MDREAVKIQQAAEQIVQQAGSPDCETAGRRPSSNAPGPCMSGRWPRGKMKGNGRAPPLAG